MNAPLSSPLQTCTRTPTSHVQPFDNTIFCHHRCNFGGKIQTVVILCGSTHIPPVNKHKLRWPWEKAAINNCQPALCGGKERSPATSTFPAYLFRVHKYPWSLVPNALPVILSKSWTEITLIASRLTQHNKRLHKSLPCPASSAKTNLSSSGMFSQSWFWWTVTFRRSTLAWVWNKF